MALAARRIRTRGLAKKAQKTDQSGEARLPDQAVRAMETQSLFRLGGSQSGWSCLEQGEQVLQGHVPEAVQRLVLVWFAHARPLPLNSTWCVGQTLDPSHRQFSREIRESFPGPALAGGGRKIRYLLPVKVTTKNFRRKLLLSLRIGRKLQGRIFFYLATTRGGGGVPPPKEDITPPLLAVKKKPKRKNTITSS